MSYSHSCYCKYYCNSRHHSLVVKTESSLNCLAEKPLSLLSSHRCRSSLHPWDDALIFVRVFSLAQSNSFFLTLLFFVSRLISSLWHGQWWGIFQPCCCCLFSAIVYSLDVSDQVGADTATAQGGPLPSTCCMREGACQQRMHESDLHFSDTLLGSDWLYSTGSGRFLQIKLQPLGGATDSWPVSYSTVIS